MATSSGCVVGGAGGGMFVSCTSWQLLFTGMALLRTQQQQQQQQQYQSSPLSSWECGSAGEDHQQLGLCRQAQQIWHMQWADMGLRKQNGVLATCCGVNTPCKPC